MNDQLNRLETELNHMTARGEMLDALGRFYDDQCSFVESDGSSRRSRTEQHDHLSGFFASLKGLNAATLHAQAVGPDVTLSEWTFDMTAGDGTPIVWNEVLVRRWRGDRVISERFYQDPTPR